MDKEAYQKVTRARADLILDHPFFGHLALRLKLVEDTKCDTAWSDGRVLAYNPLYMKILSAEKLKGLMGHVVMHPACRQKEEDDQQSFSQGDPGRSGEVRDAPPTEEGAGGIGEETPDESQWRINLAQAATRARSMGDLPAGLARFVEGLLGPKMDWRQLLHRFIQASARCDYAWMPPNRRHVHQGLYLPAMRSSDLPEAVVAIDTSGSVAASELDQFAAELSAILETCVPNCIIR